MIASSLLSAVLGSIHAFSVFIAPLEEQLQASRALVSLTYSFSLIALTFAVLIGPRVYSRVTGAGFVALVSFAAVTGTLLAASSNSLLGIWIGYSLIFGAANGFGYGYILQLSAQENVGREGIAMGVVTAAYAVGAAVAPTIFQAAAKAGGFSYAMIAFAGVLFVVGALSAAILAKNKARFTGSFTDSGPLQASALSQIRIWLGYFAGVLAGLMVIGHAGEIAISLRPGTPFWLTLLVISLFNLVGSLLGGKFADRFSPRLLLSSFPVLTMVSLTMLVLFGASALMLFLLGSIGFAYGATIAVYPAVIAKAFGVKDGARIYGRIFTAWGAAGLAGPWLAGLLYDIGGNYGPALVTAAVVSLLSAAIMAFRPFR